MSDYSATRGLDSLSHRSNRTNTFINFVKRTAEKQGYNADAIAARAKGLSSVDFCDYNMSTKIMPNDILKELRIRYDIRSKGPFRYCHNQQHSNYNHTDSAMVYIPSKLTTKLVANGFIAERFVKMERMERAEVNRKDLLETQTRKLYQYLNWTMRINNKAQTTVLLEGGNAYKVLLINTELHDQRGNALYALCIDNDVVSSKAQRWQLAALKTADEICNLLSIDRQYLPNGARAECKQFDHYRRTVGCHMNDLFQLKSHMLAEHMSSKLVRLLQCKCVQTNSRKTSKRDPSVSNGILEVEVRRLHSLIRDALQSDNMNLIPIVSIVTRKYRHHKNEDFSVDYLLPVQIDGEWVGIVFRNGFPAQALMDWYDITNKAILCDPTFDVARLSGFHNSHRRLRIMAENQCNVEMAESVHSINESYRSSPSSTPSAGPALSSLASETPSMAVNLSNESRLSSTSNTINCNGSRAQNPSDSGFVFVDEDAYNSPNPSMDASTTDPAPSITCTMPVILPIPQLYAYSVYGTVVIPNTNQLMEWMNQILVNGVHNAKQFDQYRNTRAYRG